MFAYIFLVELRKQRVIYEGILKCSKMRVAMLQSI